MTVPDVKRISNTQHPSVLTGTDAVVEIEIEAAKARCEVESFECGSERGFPPRTRPAETALWPGLFRNVPKSKTRATVQ